MKDQMTELKDSIHVLDSYNPKAFAQAQAPLVSMYLPIEKTHRSDAKDRDRWDGIEFKDLAKEAERDLARQYSNELDWAGIKERMDYLEQGEDLPVWLNAGKSLGLFITNTDVYAFNLDIDVKPCVTVGDTFYIKPLLRNLQYGMQYYLLLLNTDRFALLRGDHDGVKFVELPAGVHDEFAQEFINYDGDISALDYYSLEGHMSPYHDHKSRNEVTQEEAEKFFRYVNKVMNDKLVRDDPTPVILVTPSEHEAMFRKICTFPTLMDQTIAKDGRKLSGQTLTEDAVAIMEAERKANIADLIEKFGYDETHKKGSDDYNDIALALVERKVAVLAVEEGKDIPGSFNRTTGEVSFDPATDPTDDKILDPASPDLVDAFAQAALAQDAKIYVLAKDEMPGNKGVAAIYRYAE